MEPLLLLSNAEAGSADADALDRALGVLRATTDVEVATTSHPGELDGVLHRRGGRRVVVCGGDGSLHAVVAALHRRHELAEAVLGLVPLGTGNDFARGAGVPLDPQEAAQLVLWGQPRPVDVIVDCVGDLVVNNVHVGAGAQAARAAQTWKRRLGRAGYGVGAVRTSLDPPSVRLHVEVDGAVVTDLDRAVLQVAIGNGARVGGGARLTPAASPHDGAVDVMVSYAVGPLARFGYVARLRRGEHHRRSDVRYLRGTTITVSGEPFFCSADGEVYGPERRRTWHVQRAAFTMVVP